MGEFGSRALRDTQEAILNQQAQAAQQGYGQSMQAAQADLARQAQLAGTVGSISGADLSRIMQGGAQYGNLGQTQGQLTAQQMQNLMNLGQMQTGAGQAQQQFGLGAAAQAQQAQAQDYARQMQALQNTAELARMNQQMRTADVAALEAAGTGQQAQMQAQLNAARGQFEAARDYPKQQLDWLSTQVRGMAPLSPPVTTQTGMTSGASYSPSPLSQLATGMFTYQGLQGLR
jgi:Xaa-Pro aminopeptidase